MMRPGTIASLLVLCASLPAGAASIEVGWDRSVNFFRLRTFERDQGRGASPVIARVQDAVSQELRDKALEEVPVGADLRIVVQFAIDEFVAVTEEVFPYGGWRGWGGWSPWSTELNLFGETFFTLPSAKAKARDGTNSPVNIAWIPHRSFVVDLVQTSTETLVWRGVAKDVSALRSADEPNPKKLGKVVSEMFEDFPPGRFQLHKLTPEQRERMEAMELHYDGEMDLPRHSTLERIRGISCYRKLDEDGAPSLDVALDHLRFLAAKEGAEAVILVRCEDADRTAICRDAYICTGFPVRWLEHEAGADRAGKEEGSGP